MHRTEADERAARWEREWAMPSLVTLEDVQTVIGQMVPIFDSPRPDEGLSADAVDALLTDCDSSLISDADAAPAQPEDHEAFNLGWDYAFYGLPAPDLDDVQVSLGYQAGCGRREGAARTSHSRADRYVRKWLQLRANAWRRGRVFHQAVTVQYLQRLDVSHCPITGVALTHGTGALTDWSVDRINNEGGYGQGNLAVLSVKANAAKDRLSFEQALALAGSPSPEKDLSPVQWLRLACLMASACAQSTMSLRVTPYLTTNAPGAPMLMCQHLQAALLAEVRGSPRNVIRPIRKDCLEPKDRAGFDTVVKKLRKRNQVGVRVMDFWLHPGLFGAFSRWYAGLHIDSKARIYEVLGSRARGRRPLDVQVQTWALESGGYYAAEAEPAAEEIRHDEPGGAALFAAGAVERAAA